MGNAATFCASKRGGIWEKVVGILDGECLVADKLYLQCGNHPDTVTAVSTPTDFAALCDGGCMRACVFKLPCGHRCSRRCHPDDPAHVASRCSQPCLKELPCGHECPLVCHSEDPEHAAVVCKQPAAAECRRGHVLLTICAARQGVVALPSCLVCAELSCLEAAERQRQFREKEERAQLEMALVVAKATADAKRIELAEANRKELQLQALRLEAEKAQVRAPLCPRGWYVAGLKPVQPSEQGPLRTSSWLRPRTLFSTAALPLARPCSTPRPTQEELDIEEQYGRAQNDVLLAQAQLEVFQGLAEKRAFAQREQQACPPADGPVPYRCLRHGTATHLDECNGWGKPRPASRPSGTF